MSEVDWFRGIKEDWRKRYPLLHDDWSLRHFNLKVIAAVFFIFMTSIGPAITFAGLLKRSTGQIGVVEVLLSTAVSGGVFSIFGGQPLVILGVTGPVTILTISLYQIAETLGVNFLQFYCWVQLWAGLMHILIAASNLLDYLVYITRFSCETFGVLIALIYLYTGLSGIVGYFTAKGDDFSVALLQLLLAVGTVMLSKSLSRARDWVVFNRMQREVISDYGPTVALIIWAGISYIGRAGDEDIPRLSVQKQFSATATSDDREGGDWLIHLFDLPVWAIFLSIIPGAILTLLFVFDHNVSSIMAQAEEMRLTKGSAYHYDFMVLGVCICLTGLLGIPPCNGLIPQAPLHSKALAHRIPVVVDGVRTFEIEYVHEQRWSNLLQSLLTLLMCFPPFLTVIGVLPQSTLDGLFIYMGISSFDGNQFYERICLLVTEPESRTSKHSFLNLVPFSSIRRFTLFQLVCCMCIFGLTFTYASIAFPILIAGLVLCRIRIFPKWFEAPELEALDNLQPLPAAPVTNSNRIPSQSDDRPAYA